MTKTVRELAAAVPRRALGAALLAVVAAVALLARAPVVPCVDLCSYRSAGELARSGRPAEAYDAAALAAVHRADHDLGRRVGGFLYSPLWLPPAVALAARPLADAERLNRLAGALAVALGLGLVLYRLRSPWLRVAVAAAVALSHVGWAQLVYQNWTPVLFALLAVAILGAERGRGVVAAFAWGLALHLKAFVVVALAPLALTRRWRRVALTAVAVAALAVVSLAWADVATWRGFARQVSGLAASGVTPYYNKVSLPATVAHFLSEPRSWLAPRAPVDSPWVRWLPTAGLPLLAWGASRLRGDPGRLTAFALAWTLLFVPQIWDHTEILLLLAFPFVPARWAWTLAGLLAATWFYAPMVQRLLGRVLAGETPPLTLRLLLVFYPALALLTLAATLIDPAPEAGPVADA